MEEIKVLVIEPRPLSRLALVAILKDSPGISVVGLAFDAMQGRMQVKVRKPDILLIATDHQVEQVDKLLTELSENESIKVLMLSDKILPSSNGERKALRAGGAIISNISDDIKAKDGEFALKLRQHLQRLAQNNKSVSSKAAAHKAVQPTSKSTRAGGVAAKLMRHHNPVLDTILAIGASTGGTNALLGVVKAFPPDFSAVVIVQHIPKAFSESFVQKLNKASPMQVVSAIEGVEILHGHVYVGAGDEHFRIEKQGSKLICRVSGKDKVSGHCPSVNELFDSVAKHVGSKAVGALMTGMGEDGATGLKKMRDIRARTVAQDKKSSVVWGMPGVAVKIGAAEIEVSLDELGEKLVKLVKPTLSRI